MEKEGRGKGDEEKESSSATEVNGEKGEKQKESLTSHEKKC
jgi:hypothetical protein